MMLAAVVYHSGPKSASSPKVSAGAFSFSS